MQTRGEFHFVTPLGPGLLAKGKGSASIVPMLSRMLEKRGIRSEVQGRAFHVSLRAICFGPWF